MWILMVPAVSTKLSVLLSQAIIHSFADFSLTVVVRRRRARLKAKASAEGELVDRYLQRQRYNDELSNTEATPMQKLGRNYIMHLLLQKANQGHRFGSKRIGTNSYTVADSNILDKQTDTR